MQPFCFDDFGNLRLCGLVDYKQKTDYHLQIALIENDIIRSRALVMIKVNNVNNGLSLDSKAFIGYILENSPINTIVMKLHIMESNIREQQTSFTYQIIDGDLSQVINGELFTIDCRVFSLPR